MNFRSLRKGCVHCGKPLKTPKEKFTRTCNLCAEKAKKGFEEMGKGHFKRGMKSVLDVALSGSDKREIVEEKINKAVQFKEKAIKKRLSKEVQKGNITPQEAEEGLIQFKKGMRNNETNNNKV